MPAKRVTMSMTEALIKAVMGNVMHTAPEGMIPIFMPTSDGRRYVMWLTNLKAIPEGLPRIHSISALK